MWHESCTLKVTKQKIRSFYEWRKCIKNYKGKRGKVY